MSYAMFYAYASEVGLRVAVRLAACNGVNLTVRQLWKNRVIKELNITDL